MKKSLIIAILMALTITSCHTNQQEKGQVRSQTNNNQSEYPAIVDSMGLQALYDSTKWRIYLIMCTDTPQFMNGDNLFNPPQSFASLELKFDSLWYRNDSIAFYFAFYVHDTINLINLVRGHRYLKNDYPSGVLYSPKIDSFTFYYVSNHGDFTRYGFRSFSKEDFDTTSNKFINPFQPGVIDYIRENKDQLDPWFYKEAKKRGVIK